jgi:hypothetical protein
MLTELATACGLKRRKSMAELFREARMIDQLAEELDSPSESKLDSPLALARRLRRK